MSKWRGFIPESKSYMGYSKRSLWGKVRFWTTLGWLRSVRGEM